MEEGILTIEEQVTLLSAISSTATQKQVENIFDWTRRMRVNEALVLLIFKGVVEVSWNDETDEPMFKLNEFGKEVYANAV